MSLRNFRKVHSSWNSNAGIVLMGGTSSKSTSELVTNGVSQDYFDLKHDIYGWLKHKPSLLIRSFFYVRYACSIELDDKVILTGGLPFSSASHVIGKVTVYNHSGFVEDLPELNVKRWFHGCGYFVDENSQKVYLLIIRSS